jgi:hypothetical protein
MVGLPLWGVSILLSYVLCKMKVLPGTREPRRKTQDELYAAAKESWSPNRGVFHGGTDPGPGSQFSVLPLPHPSKSHAKPAPPASSPSVLPAEPSAYSAAPPPQPMPPAHPMQPMPRSQPPAAVAMSEHHFHLAGFLSRWGRLVLALVILGAIGVGILATPNAMRDGAGYVGMALAGIGVMGVIVLFGVALSTTRVHLTPEAVTWSGLFGRDHRGWETDSDVYRLEFVLIQRGSRHYTRWVKLVFSDGRSVKFDQCMDGFDVLAGAIQMVTQERIFSEKRAQLSSTSEATFGPVTLRTDGMVVDGTFIPWVQLRRAAIINGGLDLDTTVSGWFSTVHKYKPLGEIANYVSLLALMGEMGHAPARPMEQGYRI